MIAPLQAQAACEPTIAKPCPATSAASPTSDQSGDVAKRIAQERKKRDPYQTDIKINGSVVFEGGIRGAAPR